MSGFLFGSAAALIAALAYGSPLPLGGPPPFVAPSRRRSGLRLKVRGKQRKRLPIATGPGSISAKSEFARLIRARRFAEATDYAHAVGRYDRRDAHRMVAAIEAERRA